MASTASASELQPNADHGRLPSDLFILQSHDINPKIPVDDPQLWNDLVKRYLNLSLVERWPFYKHVLDALSEVTGATPLPSPTTEHIHRIFAPHQTAQERNLSAKFCSGFNIVWLRTCYAPSLSQAYRKLEHAAGARIEAGCLESPHHILDDASLYAFKGSHQQVLHQFLLRMPGLTDAQGIIDEYGDESLLLYGNGKNDPEAIERAEADDEYEEIKKVELDVQNLVYVVDDEAVQKSMIKIWWYDEFGKIIWDNIAKIPDSDLDGVLGAIMDGQGFVDLVGEDSQRGDVIRL